MATTGGRPGSGGSGSGGGSNGNSSNSGGGSGGGGGGGGGGSRTSVATYGSLDVSEKDQQLWLARIPPKLSAAWEAAPAGTVLGTLTFTRAANGERSVKVTGAADGKGSAKPAAPVKGNAASASSKKNAMNIRVSSEIAEQSLGGASTTTTTSDLPLEYTIEGMTSKVPGVQHPFTRRPDGSVVWHGTVHRTMAVQPVRSDRYRNLLRNRLVSSVASNRHVRTVAAGELTSGGRRNARPGGTVTSASSAAATGPLLGGSAGFGDSVRRFGKRMMEAKEGIASGASLPDALVHAAAAEGGAAASGEPSTADSMNAMMKAGTLKRKFEGQSVRSILFELFSVKRHWAVKELRSASGKLDKEIRPVLSEIANFLRSGEEKGKWELKAEFRAAAEASAAAAGDGRDGNGGA